MRWACARLRQADAAPEGKFGPAHGAVGRARRARWNDAGRRIEQGGALLARASTSAAGRPARCVPTRATQAAPLNGLARRRSARRKWCNGGRSGTKARCRVEDLEQFHALRSPARRRPPPQRAALAALAAPPPDRATVLAEPSAARAAPGGGPPARVADVDRSSGRWHGRPVQLRGPSRVAATASTPCWPKQSRPDSAAAVPTGAGAGRRQAQRSQSIPPRSRSRRRSSSAGRAWRFE